MAQEKQPAKERATLVVDKPLEKKSAEIPPRPAQQQTNTTTTTTNTDTNK